MKKKLYFVDGINDVTLKNRGDTELKIWNKDFYFEEIWGNQVVYMVNFYVTTTKQNSLNKWIFTELCEKVFEKNVL